MRKASLKILWLLIFSASCVAQTRQSIRAELFGETDAAATLEGSNLNRATRAADEALERCDGAP